MKIFLWPKKEWPDTKSFENFAISAATRCRVWSSKEAKHMRKKPKIKNPWNRSQTIYFINLLNRQFYGVKKFLCVGGLLKFSVVGENLGGISPLKVLNDFYGLFFFSSNFRFFWQSKKKKFPERKPAEKNVDIAALKLVEEKTLKTYKRKNAHTKKRFN